MAPPNVPASPPTPVSHVPLGLAGVFYELSTSHETPYQAVSGTLVWAVARLQMHSSHQPHRRAYFPLPPTRRTGESLCGHCTPGTCGPRPSPSPRVQNHHRHTALSSCGLMPSHCTSILGRRPCPLIPLVPGSQTCPEYRIGPAIFTLTHASLINPPHVSVYLG